MTVHPLPGRPAARKAPVRFKIGRRVGYALAAGFSLAAWALIIAFLASRAVASDTWRDAPPLRYQADVFTYVEYRDWRAIPAACGHPQRAVCGRSRHDICGCGHQGRMVLPAACSPTKREQSRFERIEVASLGRTFCDRLRLHEIGHVNGWSANHER